MGKGRGKGKIIIVQVKGREEIVFSLYKYLESLATLAKASSQALEPTVKTDLLFQTLLKFQTL